MKNVSVVIASRGKADMLANCLRSLAAYWPDLDVVLVEHETDELKEILLETFPEATYVQAKDEDIPARGEGGPAGHSYSTLQNLGVSMTQDRPYLLLLNNDVTARRGAINEMVNVLERDEAVGIVGAKLLRPNNTIQHIGVVFDNFGIPYHLGWDQRHERSYLPAWRSDYFDACTFAAALIRKELWTKLEGLSDDYFFNYEDVDFCLRARQLGAKTYVTQVAIWTHSEGQSSDHRQTEHHTRERNLKVFRDKWIDTGLLTDVTGLKLTRGVGPLAIEKINIGFMPSGRRSGIGWWRMDTIARMLSRKKLANVQAVFPDMGMRALGQAFDQADLMVIQGWYSEDLTKMLRGERGFKAIYEYDDHPVHLSPYAQVYRVLGTKEIFLQDPQGGQIWLWRDGQDGFDLERNRRQKALQLEAMSACDAMTTTTKPLAEFFSSLSRKVFVLPNSIDFEHFPPVYDLYRRRDGAGPRVGWWGGDNHWHDMGEVGPWLTEFINAREESKLVLIGAFYKGPFRGIDMNRVEEQGWVEVEAWPYKLATAGIDIAVIPLADPTKPFMEFNHYKSNCKWLEASAFKIPSLVQAEVAAYQDCVDGVNALTFSSKEEFLEKLDALSRDPDLRARIGQAAYDFVREHYDLEKNIYLWLEAYAEVVSGKNRSGDPIEFEGAPVAKESPISKEAARAIDAVDHEKVMRAAGSNAALPSP